MKIKLLVLIAGLLMASTMKAYRLTAYIPQENPTETMRITFAVEGAAFRQGSTT